MNCLILPFTVCTAKKVPIMFEAGVNEMYKKRLFLKISDIDNPSLPIKELDIRKPKVLYSAQIIIFD